MLKKHCTLHWFQARMLKNIMLSNALKFKCWKTQCFSRISRSDIGKHNAFQWFQARMFKNTMLFNDFKVLFELLGIPWNGQGGQMDENGFKYYVQSMFRTTRNDRWAILAFQCVQAKRLKNIICSMVSNSNVEKHDAFQWSQAQMLKNIKLFKDFKLECWKTKCVSMISS